jgi:inhibitor of KinA sporulation pathway (predicted exonuclease)
MKDKKSNKPRKLVNVIDIEACCWYGSAPINQYKEIIEIGITCVDYYSKEIVESRSIIVKPQFSEISSFCTKLTTLTPEFVKKNGISFKRACRILMDEFYSEKRMWMSWGDFERSAFEKECAFKKIKNPLGNNYINLANWYAFKHGLKQAPSVSTAIKELGLEFEGTIHRGISDSFNTARILQGII